METPGSWIIRLAARLVPPDRRAAWRREWEAEATHTWQQLARRGRPSAWSRLRLRIRVASCLIDALWERKETMTMSGLVNDVRFAVRGLMRRPGFTGVAVLTLALGIGATTAVFTLVDGVLLEPLPFPRSEELVALEHSASEGPDELPISDGLYILYKERVSALESVGMHRSTVMNVVTEGVPERVQTQLVTPDFFDVLGIQPALGRTFTQDEGLPEGEQVVVLSDGFWESAFGRRRDVLEQSIDVNGVRRRVVGVMPAGFGHPNRDTRLWVPYVVDPAVAHLAAFGGAGVGRLAPGSTRLSLDTEVSGLVGRLPEVFPESGTAAFLARAGLRAHVRPLKEAVVGDVDTTLWILLGMVGFVLLIACANVANLLLVRAEGRQREMALRVALGASRLAILRAVVAESLALAACGGLLGVGVATSAVRTTTRYLPPDFPRMAEVGIDARVLGFAALIALAIAAFFGLFAMTRYAGDDLAEQLKEGAARGSTGGRSGNRLRHGLVVVQMALALVLLVGSGLMFRSFLALQRIELGFDPEGVFTARISIPQGDVAHWAETEAVYTELSARLAAQPGVLAAGFASRAPLNGPVGFETIVVEDHPRGDDELPITSSYGQAGPGYFEAAGIEVLEGRSFRIEDRATGIRAAVVSASLARRLWPGVSPVGRRLGGDGEGNWYDIVGVVADVYYGSLTDPPAEMVYYPLVQGAPEEPDVARDLDLVVRTQGDPLQLVAVIRRELQMVNARIPLAEPRTMDELFARATSRTSFTMALLGAASGIALLLGLVGIYGVVSYVVSLRTREIGMRMALGASASSVRRMVVRQGLVLAGAGVLLGIAVAAALSRLMASVLFGVRALDPATYGSVAAALLAVATLACWVPALRAASVDPSRALRDG